MKVLNELCHEKTCLQMQKKGADLLHSNCPADQHLGFLYVDSMIPLLPKSEISSLYPSSVAAQLGSCRSCLETLKTTINAAVKILKFKLRSSTSIKEVHYDSNQSLL